MLHDISAVKRPAQMHHSITPYSSLQEALIAKPGRELAHPVRTLALVDLCPGIQTTNLPPRLDVLAGFLAEADIVRDGAGAVVKLKLHALSITLAVRPAMVKILKVLDVIVCNQPPVGLKASPSVARNGQ